METFDRRMVQRTYNKKHLTISLSYDLIRRMMYVCLEHLKDLDEEGDEAELQVL